MIDNNKKYQELYKDICKSIMKRFQEDNKHVYEYYQKKIKQTRIMGSFIHPWKPDGKTKLHASIKYAKNICTRFENDMKTSNNTNAPLSQYLYNKDAQKILTLVFITAFTFASEHFANLNLSKEEVTKYITETLKHYNFN